VERDETGDVGTVDSAPQDTATSDSETADTAEPTSTTGDPGVTGLWTGYCIDFADAYDLSLVLVDQNGAITGTLTWILSGEVEAVEGTRTDYDVQIVPSSPGEADWTYFQLSWWEDSLSGMWGLVRYMDCFFER
jgi:hypothetical protein